MITTLMNRSILHFISNMFVPFSCTNYPSEEKDVLQSGQQKTEQKTKKKFGSMVFIEGGTFEMGGNTEQADTDEFPRHKKKVASFWMDINEVTNQQFSEFVAATGYKTVAERPIDWEELKKQLPQNTPKPADAVAAGLYGF